MNFSVSTGSEIQTPSEAQIREALSTLDVERDGEGFAILGPTDMTYVQVAGDPDTGFIVEYQEGSVDSHYRSKRNDYSLDEVVAIFVAYQDGSVDWPETGKWSRISW